MIDFSIARENMVESQIRPNGVTDRKVIDAMADIPREAFLPKSVQPLAYMDEDVTVSTGPEPSARRTLMEPMSFARLIQLAEVKSGDLVLDVGCCLGYSSAVLARIADAVVALESDEDLAASAVDILVEQNVDNAAVVTGPLADGFSSEGPYDAIILNGAVPEVPAQLLEQLKQGGRLVAVVADGTVGRMQVFIRNGDIFAEKIGFNATVASLPGFAKKDPAFVF